MRGGCFRDVEVIHYRGAADTRVRKLDNAELQKLPDGGAVGGRPIALLHGAHGALSRRLERVGLASRIAYEFPVRKCCRRWGRASSRWNARAHDLRRGRCCR